MIEWNEKYMVGIDNIDRQHELLVDKINHLLEMHEKSEDLHVISTLFIGLIHYFTKHFEYEETIMRGCNYPGLERRKLEHKIFYNNLEKTKNDFINGEISSLGYIIDYIKLWVMDHIIIQDKKYANKSLLKVNT